MILTTYIEQDPDTGMYIGVIPGIPGAHSQAETLDELQGNMQEVLELCLEEQPERFEHLPRFIGIQQVELAA
ncbi:MAG TPA: type II toxin-antitoxin system HicB family antitoxin [Candidatus Kapabacteria bacterium]|nr:type II toxin-antitoxin system HicB family antitoxin [Candidatus Kapabacteria bacterium]